MKKNHGFTFVELIITIAIVSILSGTAIYSLGYLKSTNVKACVNDINSMLDKARVLSMTKETKPTLYIYWLDGDIYMKLTTGTLTIDDQGTKLGSDAITITGILDGPPPVDKIVAGGNYLTIKFQRSNGALEDDGSDALGMAPAYNRIKVTNGTSTYYIEIVKSTGKHYIH